MYMFKMLKINKVKDEKENKENEVTTYKEAFDYIRYNSNKLKFTLSNKKYDFCCDFYFMYSDKLLKTNKILNSLLDEDATKRIYINSFEGYRSINIDAVNTIEDELSLNTINFNQILPNIKLSNKSKIIFERIKAIIDLLSSIKDKIGTDNFIYYYLVMNTDSNKAIEDIISVTKVFDELRKQTLKLIDNYKEDLHYISANKINSCLNKIISK